MRFTFKELLVSSISIFLALLLWIIFLRLSIIENYLQPKPEPKKNEIEWGNPYRERIVKYNPTISPYTDVGKMTLDQVLTDDWKE